MKTAAHAILAKRKETKFWQSICLGLTLLFGVTILYREIFPKPRPDVLIVGPSGYHLAKLKSFSEAGQLHLDQAEIASIFLLQRSPGGLDYPERIKSIFGTSAFEKAMTLVAEDRDEFRTKSLHQKVEISQTKILNIRDRSVLVSIEGQLIRTGDFEGKPFVESLKLKAQMTFVRNPDLIAKGDYPTIVTDFEIQTTPIAAH